MITSVDTSNNAASQSTHMAPDSQALINALMAILPAEQVLWQPQDTTAYDCDGLAQLHEVPRAVVLPDTEAQIVAILKVCAQHRVPIVPRGAGTGLSGGAMPISEGIVLSTARMKQIVHVDALARTAVVQPGVRNISISETVAPLGFYYAPDPSSQIACTIGGNVAENSGGLHCLKYGLTVHNVLSVRAVLMSGEVVVLGSAAPDAPGLDLLAVMMGSEGMLAVVTEVTVRLIPKPMTAQLIMASFDDMAKAGQAVADVVAAGIIPAGLEMMDKAATAAVEEFVHAGYDMNAQAILLCESDGTPEEVAEEIERMIAVLNRSGATQIQVSQSEEERVRFWSGRKNAFPAAGRISPDYYCMDGTIPRKHIAQLLTDINVMEAKYALRCMNVFHAGDGNMHPLILFNGADEDEWHRAEAFGTEILERCVALGGTVTGEHGVGLEKINSMCVQFSDTERAAFFALKGAFDPQRLLNPNKALPTLHRCAEYGRVHVHRGQLAHADLERF